MLDEWLYLVGFGSKLLLIELTDFMFFEYDFLYGLELVFEHFIYILVLLSDGLYLVLFLLLEQDEVLLQLLIGEWELVETVV